MEAEPRSTLLSLSPTGLEVHTRSTLLSMSPTGLEVRTTFGTLLFNAEGFKVFTTEGAELHLSELHLSSGYDIAHAIALGRALAMKDPK